MLMMTITMITMMLMMMMVMMMMMTMIMIMLMMIMMLMMMMMMVMMMMTTMVMMMLMIMVLIAMMMMMMVMMMMMLPLPLPPPPMMMMMMMMRMMKLMMILMLIMIIIHNPTAAWGGKKTHWQADRSCSCLRSYWALNKSNGLFGFCLTCCSLLQKFKSIGFFRAATCLACLDQFFFGKQSIHWARLLYIFKWWSLFCWCTNFLYSKECDLNRNTISHIENMLRDMASTLNSRGAPELRKLAIYL